MKPLAVALSALIHNNKILLIKRNKEPYLGYWCFPGGKIEFGEHITTAAKREILEETGITTDYVKLNGIYTENLYSKEEIKNTFILFVNTLKPHHNNHVNSDEGDLHWFDLDSIDDHKNDIIPNDFLVIKKMIIDQDGFYYETDMEEKDNSYIMNRFDKIN